MTIHAHARCDQCERILVAEPNEAVDEDYVLSTGWVSIGWQEGDPEDPVREARDFCSFGCAAQWSLVQVSSSVES